MACSRVNFIKKKTAGREGSDWQYTVKAVEEKAVIGSTQ